MGLVEKSIPLYGFNIKPPLMSSVVIYTKGTSNSQSSRWRRHLRVRIPEGRYKPKDYVRTFNKMVEDDVGPVKVKSRIRYDEYSNRIVFMVAFGEVVEVDNVKLHRMFGMRRDVFALSNSKPGKKNLCDAPTLLFQCERNHHVRLLKHCGVEPGRKHLCPVAPHCSFGNR